ncbi:MAG: GyrI-like domain-containing protein, partial [Pseudomonadota bacterium]|nr:GyrI-like domain-containing protein [Pseudomonadota bacterium]
HAARYSSRINKVLDYIHAHLDDELSVDTLSRIAHFSRFHFHRQFSDYTGITVTRLVQLLRLRRASLQLVFNKRARITDIAFQAGFANAESFSRAFRREHGQTPTAFRSNPRWVPWQSAWLPQPVEEQQWKVELCEFPAMYVAVIEHRGPREQVPIAMAKLFEWRQANARKYDIGGAYGIYPCDPERTPPEQLRIEFAVEVDRPVAPGADGIHNKLIPEGRCAVLRNVAAYQAQNAIRWLFREWLPGSGEQLRDFPLYCHFVTADAGMPENKKAVDVYVPLR